MLIVGSSLEPITSNKAENLIESTGDIQYGIVTVMHLNYSSIKYISI